MPPHPPGSLRQVHSVPRCLLRVPGLVPAGTPRHGCHASSGGSLPPPWGFPATTLRCCRGDDPANPTFRQNIPSPGAAQAPVLNTWATSPPKPEVRELQVGAAAPPPVPHTAPPTTNPIFPPRSAELPGPANKKNNKDMENSIISLSSFLDLAFVNSKQTPGGGGGAEGGNQIKPESRHGKPVFTKKDPSQQPQHLNAAGKGKKV